MKRSPKENNTYSKKGHNSKQDIEEFYDQKAGALYGAIINIVNKEVIAAKVLEGTFKRAFVEKNIKAPRLVSEFTSILIYAKKKSVDTLKAIEIFKACNDGRECVIYTKPADR
jgi:hypothetical protein